MKNDLKKIKLLKTTKSIHRAIAIIFLVVFIIGQGSVLAYTSSEFSAILNNTGWWDPNASSCSNILTSSGSSFLTSNASQIVIGNAQTIIGIDKTYHLGKNGALIGLIVGLDESGLENHANTMVPVSELNPNKQGNGSDMDSVGIFQQRVASGWSTLAPAAPANIESSSSLSQQYANSYPAAVNQLMTPSYAAEAFYHRLSQLPNWQSMNPWVAAQKIQRSNISNGSNYQAEIPNAMTLINNYYASAPIIPLPVNLTIPTTNVSMTSGFNTSFICGASSNGVVNGSIVQTAIGLSWPNNSHGNTPTTNYVAAMEQYNKAGYTETQGLGNDCGVFVSTVMRASGVDPNYPVYNTVNQANYVISHPNLYTVIYPATSISQLQPGDILILNTGTVDYNLKIHVGLYGGGAGGHTFIYTGLQNSTNTNDAYASLGSQSATLGTAYLSDSRGQYLIARYKGTL